jgi:hypothetical protein
MPALRWIPVTAHDLIQELAFLRPSCLSVSLPLDDGVLPTAARVTGSLRWTANRDF